MRAWWTALVGFLVINHVEGLIKWSRRASRYEHRQHQQQRCRRAGGWLAAKQNSRSRRELLLTYGGGVGGLLLGWAPLFGGPGASRAYIPVYEDDYAPTTTTTKTTAVGAPPAITDPPTAGPNELRAYLAASSAELARLRPLIRTQAWDNVFSSTNLKTGMFRYIGSPRFGGSAASMAIALAGADAAAVEEAREDIVLSLRELADYALENRVVFFNSADRKDVETLASESGALRNVDLSEPLELLDRAEAQVAALRKLL